MVVDGLLLRVVQQEGFQKFVSLTAPPYQLPSPKTLSRRVSSLYSETFQLLCERLRNVDTLFNFTTDIWSSSHQHSYICVTVSFIDGGVLFHTCICVKRIKGAHTSEAISIVLHDIFHSVSVDQRLFHAITDNAPNMRKACKLLNVFQSGCCAHLLHLVIMNGCGLWLRMESNSSLSDVDTESSNNDSTEEDDESGYDKLDSDELEVEFPSKSIQRGLNETLEKVRRIVKFFRRSNKAMEVLQSAPGLNPSQMNLCIDVKMRWNSTLKMCQSMLVNKQQLLYALNFEQLSNCFHSSHLIRDLNNLDWQRISSLVEVLEIFKQCSEDLSGAQYPILCRVFVIRRLLKDSID